MDRIHLSPESESLAPVACPPDEPGRRGFFPPANQPSEDSKNVPGRSIERSGAGSATNPKRV
jgi:hypothetical protein